MRRLALLLVPAALWAAADAPPAVRVGHPAEADWRPSTSLPPGAEYHLVREDPANHGVQVLVRFPSGFAVPLHTHSCTETLVVLSGKLALSADGKETGLKAGDYAVIPGGSPHALKVSGWGKAVFTAATDGPYDFKALDPEAPAGRQP